MHSDFHHIFDRTQLSVAVESCSVTALYYDYILEINLTKRQTVYEWFYSTVMILCYLIKMDVGKTNDKGLSSTISHIGKNDRLFCCSQRLKSIVNNRINVNLMIKQYTVCRYLQYFYKNLFFTFRARKPPRKGTENAYTIC